MAIQGRGGNLDLRRHSQHNYLHTHNYLIESLGPLPHFLESSQTQSRDVKEVQESDVYAEANELATQLVTADSSG